MKDFIKKLMMNLNDDENVIENNNIDSKNYDLINLFKQTANNNKYNSQNRNYDNSNYDYDYKLDDESENFLSNQKNLKNMDYFDQRFMDENLEINPFLVDKKKYGSSLKKLFMNTDVDTSYINDFNTETKIDFLGGLTLWQFTAILISILLFIGLAIYLFRKVNLYMMQKVSSETPNDRLANFRSSSVHTSYSIDSSNQLLPKNMVSFKTNDNFRLQSNYTIKPTPRFV